MVCKKFKIVTYQLSEIRIEDGKITGVELVPISIVGGTDRKIKKAIKRLYKDRDVRVVSSSEKIVTYEMNTDAFIANAASVTDEAAEVSGEKEV